MLAKVGTREGGRFMRRIAITAISAITIVVASLVLVASGRLGLHAPTAAAQGEGPAQVGAWELTLTDTQGQTTPVLLTLATGGTATAAELPVPAGALTPTPSEAPSASPGEGSPSPAETPQATELPAQPSGLLNSPGQGVWTPTSDTGLIFTYEVLQSDQAGAYVQKVTVSGTADLDDTGDALTGSYNMQFTAPDGTAQGSSSGTILGTRIQMALIAAFDASQAAGSKDVKFTDQSTGVPTGWNWDFGDGSLSADQNPSHTYKQPGDYTVTLTVTDDNGGTATATQTITVNEVTKPTADFMTAQTPGTLEIKFTDQSTGGPNAWSWDFGDGKTGSKQNPKHTYAKTGNYKVTLKVSNAGGSDTSTHTVNVAKPPTAGFTVGTASTALEIKFTDTSKGTPDAWAWDFGDGGTSTKPNPRHTYAKAGDYTVKLTVTNNAGTNTDSQSITVPLTSGESPSPSESATP
jgi:PKD repeat protein